MVRKKIKHQKSSRDLGDLRILDRKTTVAIIASRMFHNYLAFDPMVTQQELNRVTKLIRKNWLWDFIKQMPDQVQEFVANNELGIRLDQLYRLQYEPEWIVFSSIFQERMKNSKTCFELQENTRNAVTAVLLG